MANAIARNHSFGELLTLRDAMNKVFEESFVWPGSYVNRDTTRSTWTLPVDVHETKDDLVVTAVVPGAKTEDVTIQFEDGRLTIKANLAKPAHENVTWHYQEIGYGTYAREITLPFAIQTDKVEATLQNGYLTLCLPKAEQVKPKTIKVQAK